MSSLDLIFSPDSWYTKLLDENNIKRHFHESDNLNTLGTLLVQRVKSRTPVLTGSLMADERFEIDTEESSDVLVTIYADATNQMDTWGRIYDIYQEGGELGLPTYTNPPREMFARVETEDLGLIESWGLMVLSSAVDEIGNP